MRTMIHIAAMGLLLGLSLPAVAVHKCTDKNGKVTYQNTPCGTNAVQQKDVRLHNTGRLSRSSLEVEMEREYAQSVAALKQKEKELAALEAELEALKAAERELRNDDLMANARRELRRQPAPPEPVIAAAKMACMTYITQLLKDPESAKFGETIDPLPKYAEEDGSVTPGIGYLLKVNARNSYGGYTGMQTWKCMVNRDSNEVIGAMPVK